MHGASLTRSEGHQRKRMGIKAESYVALVDARRLDHYHRLEREHLHKALLHEALAGSIDVRNGATLTARKVLAKYRR
jgi:hypothetical protein